MMMATTKNKMSAGNDGETGMPVQCWWKGKMVQLLWNTVWLFLKK